MNVTEADYKFLAIEQATSPAAGGFFLHYVNSWWATHSEKGLAFYNPRNRRRQHGMGAPQCNSSEAIARMIGAETMPWQPEIRYLASVWIPISIEDYR